MAGEAPTELVMQENLRQYLLRYSLEDYTEELYNIGADLDQFEHNMNDETLTLVANHVFKENSDDFDAFKIAVRDYQKQQSESGTVVEPVEVPYIPVVREGVGVQSTSSPPYSEDHKLDENDDSDILAILQGKYAIDITTTKEMAEFAFDSGCSDFEVDRLLSVFNTNCDTSQLTSNAFTNLIKSFVAEVELLDFVSLISITSKKTRRSQLEAQINEVSGGANKASKQRLLRIFDNFHERNKILSTRAKLEQNDGDTDESDDPDLEDASQEVQLVVTDKDCIITLLHTFLSEIEDKEEMWSKANLPDDEIEQRKESTIQHLTVLLLYFINFLADQQHMQTTRSLLDWLQRIVTQATFLELSVPPVVSVLNHTQQQSQHAQQSHQNEPEQRVNKIELGRILMQQWRQWIVTRCEAEINDDKTNKLRHFRAIFRQKESIYVAFRPIATKWIGGIVALLPYRAMHAMNGVHNGIHNGMNAMDANGVDAGNEPFEDESDRDSIGGVNRISGIHGLGGDEFDEEEKEFVQRQWYCLCETDTIGEKIWSYVPYNKVNQTQLTNQYFAWRAQAKLADREQYKRVEVEVDERVMRIFFQEKGEFEAVQLSPNDMRRMVVFDRPDKDNYIRGFPVFKMSS